MAFALKREEELRLAAERGDKNSVISLLAQGINVNSTNVEGETALDKACYKGQTGVALTLIEKGANVRTSDKLGYTPLMGASRGGHKILVQALIRQGADVNVSNMYGDTALHKVSLCGNNEEVTTILIQNGAKVNFANFKGETPLHEATVNRREKIIEILLQYGANIEAVNQDGQTALDIAIEYGHEGCIQLLTNPIKIANKSEKSISKSQGQNEKLISELIESNTSLLSQLNEIKTEMTDKRSEIQKLKKKVQELTDINVELKSKINQIEIVKDDKKPKYVSYFEPKSKPIVTKSNANIDNPGLSSETLSNTLEITGLERKADENLDFIVSSIERVLGLYFIQPHICSVTRPYTVSQTIRLRRRLNSYYPRTDSTVIEVKFHTVEFTRMWMKAYEKLESNGILASALDWSYGDKKIIIKPKSVIN